MQEGNSLTMSKRMVLLENLKHETFSIKLLLPALISIIEASYIEILNWKMFFSNETLILATCRSKLLTLELLDHVIQTKVKNQMLDRYLICLLRFSTTHSLKQKLKSTFGLLAVFCLQW